MASGSSTIRRCVLVLGSALALAGCNGTELPGFLSGGGSKTTAAETSARTVERDVEAPEVFQITDSGLWDGRPSLGGVWVAHPQVKDPERVIIRNESNGQFVIGVIYRPERSTPGPKFQVSSDAAEALDMLAGQPAQINVTALRRETAPAPVEESETLPDAPVAEPRSASSVATSTLDPIEAAAEALDAAASAPSVPAAAVTPPATAAAPTPPPAPAPNSTLEKPYVQIGIFSVESNANRTAEALRKAGMVPTVKEGKMSGKAFWRVVIGPATTAAERATLLGQIKALGFNDAYAVTN